MFFMPDIVLVQDGSRVGAVPYADLNVRWQESRFIETERVPSDAKVVDHTWQHPNKSGGPDRRYKDNRQIPICLYEGMHFTSNSGVNELVEFSRTGVAAAFVDGCRMLATLPRERTSPPLLTLAKEMSEESAAPRPARIEKRRGLIPMLSVLAILMSVSVLGIYLKAEGKKADTVLQCVFRKNGTVVSLNRGQWFH